MRFIQGEIRNVDFEIISCDNKDFQIQSATVELVYLHEVVKTIPVQMKNHSLSFMIDTTYLEGNFYNLVVTIDLGIETIKKIKEVEIIHVQSNRS